MQNPILIETNRIRDGRGFFSEIYRSSTYREKGVRCEFVQDNHSFSLEAGTVRGLHAQAPPRAQDKLVMCLRGAIFDVAVDLRKGSPRFGEWFGFELSALNGRQLFIPSGFAHGFMTLQRDSEVIYKCSDYYAPESEISILWNDASLGIEWPRLENLVVSDKDASAIAFDQFESPYIWEEI